VEHDVIVVGGGPGGSTAAWRLAVAGARPLVLDAAVFPRVKICAGWVTPAALADLEIDPEKYPLTIQPFTTCTLTFEGTRHETRWRRPASYGILRREFDHYLLERAAASGADVRGGLRVTDVCVRRDAVLEEVIGRAIGLIDCTPTGEIDEARHLVELVGRTWIHATPRLVNSERSDTPLRQSGVGWRSDAQLVNLRSVFIASRSRVRSCARRY